MKLGLAQKRPEININYAQALGENFRAHRENLKLSLQEVADKLLLSKNQILGLETGDPEKFYGNKLFAQAADKYAAFINLDSKPSIELLEIVSETEPPIICNELLNSEPEPKNGPTSHQKLRTSKHFSIKQLISFGALFIAGIGILSTQFLTNKSQNEQEVASNKDSGAPVSADPPPTPIETTSTAEKMATETSPAPAQKDNEADVKTGFIRIEFNGNSWVQIVQTNGTKQEKMYHRGDVLDLEPGKLQALIIGNVSVVETHNREAAINLKPYVASDSQVARIIGPDIRKLAN
jgi:cytoskeletal protein RodZ